MGWGGDEGRGVRRGVRRRVGMGGGGNDGFKWTYRRSKNYAYNIGSWGIAWVLLYNSGNIIITLYKICN